MRCILFALFMFFGKDVFANEISIYLSPKSNALEQLAATELVKYLNQMYTADNFIISRNKDETILINLTVKSDGSSTTNNYREGFHVYNRNNQLIIQANSAQGLLYGVYSLLEHIGCYFRLSDEFIPVFKNRSFQLPTIDLKDSPLVNKRIIFNWHNFLSGCSTWNLDDWEHYIRQSVKLRYNTLMVHAYGNNPMIQFSYNEQTKPIGYLTSTNLGRDWGTENVNDVRNMIGADDIYSGKVFAAKAAMVNNIQRHEAVKKLMQQVFDYAHKWGLKVLLAYDMDTYSANPQNIIRTLSSHSLFTVMNGEISLVNPDTEEGYNYYKSQLTQIFNDYPQIDEYAVWNRANINGTAWGSVREGDMPNAWKEQYQQKFHGDTNSYDCVVFAWSKIVNTYKRILKDIGKEDVELATGSWRFNFLRPMDLLTDKTIAFIPLDYNINFDKEDVQSKIKTISSSRRIIPILWAHHDDHSYVGRPYRPFENIATIFEQAHIRDFGIIHWMTRPLDCYFKNTMQQVWQYTRNQSLEITLGRYSSSIFKDHDSLLFKKYLIRWMDDAPIFGRETTDKFMDHALEEPGKRINESASRITLLKSIHQDKLPTNTKSVLSFFIEYERFIESFYNVQGVVDSAKIVLKNGDLLTAARLISNISPEETINYFSSAIRNGEITRGEMGLLVSLNTRWLPYVVSFKQALGLHPISYIFGVTRHEELAQGPGRFTFHFDGRGNISECLGEKETGLKELSKISMCKDQFCGVIIDSSFDYTFKPFVGSDFQQPVNGNIYLYITGVGNQKVKLELSQEMVKSTAKQIVFEGKETKQVILPVHFTGGSSTVKLSSNGPIIMKKMVFKPEIAN